MNVVPIVKQPPYMVVDESDAGAVAMICERLGTVGLHPGGRVIAFRDKEGIRGAFYFERYTGVNGSINVHWVGRDRRWLTSSMLTLAFAYAFTQLQCRVMFSEVKADQAASLDINARLGFRRVGRLVGYYPGDDLIINALRREECVWIPEEDRKEATNVAVRG